MKSFFDICTDIPSRSGFFCDSCWSRGNKMCLICDEQRAQNGKQFRRCCVRCFSDKFSTEEDQIIRDESDRYLSQISQQQTWDGTEPALQLLLLPSNGSVNLPSYATTPEFLSPSHCRLCSQSYGGGRRRTASTRMPWINEVEF